MVLIYSRNYFFNISVIYVNCVEATVCPLPETFEWNEVNCEFWLDLTQNLTENTN